jgi:hypothetical protein
MCVARREPSQRTLRASNKANGDASMDAPPLFSSIDPFCEPRADFQPI